MNESEKEKSEAYAKMMESWAWKDFWSFISKQREDSIAAICTIDTKDASNFHLGSFVGAIKLINSLENELGFITRKP